MLKSLLSIVRDWSPESSANAPSVEVAGLALLLEISRADHHHSAAEQAAIIAAAAQVFTLEPQVVEQLLTSAENAVDQAVSLVEFTQLLNERLDRAAKLRLLVQLWRVAYADGALDRYEEYYLRKITDLLHLSHSDLIRTKLAVISA
jgi:uncharacterized tellurite resistance protein B-like protein